MLAKVNTVDNYGPQLRFIQGLKMVIQVCQCCYFLCKENKETDDLELFLKQIYLQIDNRTVPLLQANER